MSSRGAVEQHPGRFATPGSGEGDDPVPRTSLRPHPTSAAAARRFVADVLLNRGFADGCVEQAMLVTSEVVTSAVVRTGSGVELVVVADHPMVRVEVRDFHTSSSHHQDSDDATGLGSTLVDTLAEGVGRTAGGRPRSVHLVRDAVMRPPRLSTN